MSSTDIPTYGMLGPVKCSTHTIEDLLREIYALLYDKSLSPRIISCLNAHIFNLAWNDSELLDALNQSRIVAADGMSIVWMAKLFGFRIRERCNMTEAFRAFMSENCASVRAILVGGTEQMACAASQTIRNQCPTIEIVGEISGYLEEDAYRDYFRNHTSVDFVLLGLGSPQTEILSLIASEECPGAIVWHIGGGTIAFLAGYLTEAPMWMRRSGLQWTHRLYLEPGRMWRRYLIGNFQFIFRVLMYRAKTAILQTKDQRT